MPTRLILMMLLVVVSGSAAAGWVEVGSNEAEGITVYTNPGTIRKVGNKVKMWSLSNYDTYQESVGKSMKNLDEYDCKEERARVLHFSSHSENMGGGRVVATATGPDSWTPISPDSIGAILWKFACRKR